MKLPNNCVHIRNWNCIADFNLLAKTSCIRSYKKWATNLRNFPAVLQWNPTGLGFAPFTIQSPRHKIEHSTKPLHYCLKLHYVCFLAFAYETMDITSQPWLPFSHTGYYRTKQTERLMCNLYKTVAYSMQTDRHQTLHPRTISCTTLLNKTSLFYKSVQPGHNSQLHH